MPQIIVLGAAAGGGFPQWNCNCTNCQLAWQGSDKVKPRTQSSLAVSADSRHWVILNASPDIRQQIAATPELQPRSGTRDSPISSIVLTNADVDHAQTRELQNRCLRALTFKTELLWAQLDALHHAYVEPGLIPPGAFVPAGCEPTVYER